MAGEIEKRAIGFNAAHSGGTPKADASAPWNGPSEVASAPNEAGPLRRMHTWVDSEGDAEAKSSYKLPHHRSDGTVVLRGVRAAVGAILGARGGVAIPTADKRAAYNHLAKHLREFDQEPPAFVERAIAKSGDAFFDDSDDDLHLAAQAWAAGGELRQFSTRFKVAKVDDEQGIVFGWASVSEREDGSLVFDHEGDAIFPEELEKAAYGFVLDARVASDQHDEATLGCGQLVESMFFSKDKQEALGIEVPVGWWVGFHVADPEIRKSIREEGGHAMFSIGGTGCRTEL